MIEKICSANGMLHVHPGEITLTTCVEYLSPSIIKSWTNSKLELINCDLVPGSILYIFLEAGDRERASLLRLNNIK